MSTRELFRDLAVGFWMLSALVAGLAAVDATPTFGDALCLLIAAVIFAVLAIVRGDE